VTDRYAFVMENGLGHVTHRLNLESVLQEESRFDAAVLPVRPGETPGVKPLPLIRNWSVQTSWAARRSLQACSRPNPPDALFIHTQVAALFTKRIARRVPTIVSLDATPINFDSFGEVYGHSRQSRAAEIVKLKVNRRALSSASSIVTWSKWAAASVVEDYGIPTERVHVIHPGVQLGRYAPRADPRQPGPIRVLFVGGDYVRKGGPELVQAVASMQGEVELDVVTSSSGVEVPRGAPIRVHNDVSPNSDRLQELLTRADVFALPTWGDCLGMAIAEAMACGLPIVATKVGGVPELVREGETGLFVSIGSPRDIGQALGRLASDSSLRESMGRAGRALVESEHDATANWRRIFDLMQEQQRSSRPRVASEAGASRTESRSA
jgi:glycosyltransferase involved in cell wall biosynthesis